MGLGKTLQTIAALLARRQEGESTFPDLIICPTSLLYNWKKEFERFAPELSVCLVTGTATQRTGEYVAFAYDGRPCDEGEAGICGRNDPEVSGKTCAFYNVRDDPAA